MRGPAEDHCRELSVRERRSVRAYFNGTADHMVMVAGGMDCVNKGPEVAVALQWKRVICRYLLFRNWAYAMMACKREIGRLE